MTVLHIVDPARLLVEALDRSSPGLLRQLLQTMVEPLLSVDADTVVGRSGASSAKVARRNATSTVAVTWMLGSARSTWRPLKLQQGTYFPEWLLACRKRAETALITVVAGNKMSKMRP